MEAHTLAGITLLTWLALGIALNPTSSLPPEVFRNKNRLELFYIRHCNLSILGWIHLIAGIVLVAWK